MLIRFEIGDWLKNASIVGIYKVLMKAQKKIDDIKVANNYIEFDDSLLENFAENYFETITDEYRNELTYFKIVDKDIEHLSTLEEINGFIDFVKVKLTSESFISAYNLANRNELVDKFKNIKKVMVKKNFTDEEKEELIKKAKTELEEIQEILSDKTIKKYITAKNCMYQVIKNFYSDNSFLNSKNKDEDMIMLYKKDFVDRALAYQSVDKKKFKLNCCCCDELINSNTKTKFSWLNEQGIDSDKKTNYFWDGYVDLYMCDACVLLYSCACLGFNKKYNKAIFINNNRSANDLIQTNIVKVVDKNNISNVTAMTYFNVLKYMQINEISSNKFVMENIQVVKMDTDNSRLFEFSILTKNLLKLLYYNRKDLERISTRFIKVTDNYTLDVFTEVMNNLYLNKCLYGLVDTIFYFYFKDLDKNKCNVSMNTIEIIQRIEGGKRMKKSELESSKLLGKELGTELMRKGLDSKLSTLNYRLLNSLRTNDSNRFIDTILDIHIYLRKNIHTDILQIKQNDTKLKDFGYAYLVGLNSVKSSGIKEGNKDEE